MKKNRQDGKERKRPFRWIWLILILAAVTAGAVYSRFGGFGPGRAADPEEFASYAESVEKMAVPDEARVIALGEAAHGCAEFQELKLDVFRVLVEDYGVRAFALEGDYGGCEAADRYIQGGEGSAREAAAAIGFAIYRTDQMEALIQWMRDYNETAEEEDRLRFYGFDMQRCSYNYRFLLEDAEALGLDVSGLEEIWDPEADDFSEACGPERREEILKAVREDLAGREGDLAEKACQHADILLQNMELGRTMDSGTGYAPLRDSFMATNVRWILDREKESGSGRIFVSAHNGHIEKRGNYGGQGKVMGNLLADELGEGYYAVGTDFYKAGVNLPEGKDGKRSVHTFYSHDPLAAAAHRCGLAMSWLDFSALPEGSSLRQQTEDYMWMGSLGELYSPLMLVLPQAYRVWDSPAVLYDSMIFVSDAHPTKIRAAD